jgi:hypothetical protein
MITVGGKEADRRQIGGYHGFACHAIICSYDDVLIRRRLYRRERLA